MRVCGKGGGELIKLTMKTDVSVSSHVTNAVAHSASTVATTPNLNLPSPTVSETSQTSGPQLEPDVTTGSICTRQHAEVRVSDRASKSLKKKKK